MTDHYKTLGLSRQATQDEIRAKYRELARQFHPDVNPSSAAKEQFLRVQEAYQVLSNPERRKQFDALLQMNQRPPKPKPRPTQSQPNKGEEYKRLLHEAELAFVAGRFFEALAKAKAAAKIQPRSALAHTIVGDVYRIQGKSELALSSYTIALQLDPNNDSLQKKFTRLAKTRAAEPATPIAPAADGVKMAAQIIGFSGCLFTVFMALLAPGQAIGSAGIGAWSSNLLLYMAICGLLLGVLMSASGWVQAVQDALPIKGPGLILALIALLCFPLSAAIYALISTIHGGGSPSLNKAYGAAGLFAILFAVAYFQAFGATLLFGGNVVFAGLLTGWFVSDWGKSA
ncbi:MAG: DnaJ domain-containing protein [Armatimonadetes bacterium]|nr:DnaJ domain-containing protein [Armatimonadota bacterium]